MERDDFAAEILSYLVAHPLAKDTISGIEKWWLAGDARAEGKRKIEEALSMLVARGWLIGRSSPQSGTIYSLNGNSLGEIRAFLDEPR